MPKTPRRPRDVSQLAKMMVDIATGETDTQPAERQKDPAAVERGRAGGLKGGRARAENLTPEERQKQALLAARSRWKA